MKRFLVALAFAVMLAGCLENPPNSQTGLPIEKQVIWGFTHNWTSQEGGAHAARIVLHPQGEMAACGFGLRIGGANVEDGMGFVSLHGLDSDNWFFGSLWGGEGVVRASAGNQKIDIVELDMNSHWTGSVGGRQEFTGSFAIVAGARNISNYVTPSRTGPAMTLTVECHHPVILESTESGSVVGVLTTVGGGDGFSIATPSPASLVMIGQSQLEVMVETPSRGYIEVWALGSTALGKVSIPGFSRDFQSTPESIMQHHLEGDSGEYAVHVDGGAGTGDFVAGIVGLAPDTTAFHPVLTRPTE